MGEGLEPVRQLSGACPRMLPRRQGGLRGLGLGLPHRVRRIRCAFCRGRRGDPAGLNGSDGSIQHLIDLVTGDSRRRGCPGRMPSVGEWLPVPTRSLIRDRLPREHGLSTKTSAQLRVRWLHTPGRVYQVSRSLGECGSIG